MPDENGILGTAEPQFVPSGHFYSPIPSIAEIKEHEQSIFGLMPAELQGIDLRENGQKEWLEILRRYYDVMPYKPIDAIYSEIESYIKKYSETQITSEKDKIKQEAIERYNVLIKENKPESTRYLLENPSYGYADGIIYHCLLRHVKPRRVIEVGAGYSTCLLLDTNETYFNGSIEFTCIEPHIECLFSLVREQDKKTIQLLRSKIQDVDTAIFDKLEKNDILFVDSSHICKTYSDVNHILFNILPRLQSGVYIHFHDIFWPFEYPKDWIYEGRFWNESYLLRAFLSYNNAFSIEFFTSYMQSVRRNELEAAMPLLMRGEGGSLWLQKK